MYLNTTLWLKNLLMEYIGQLAVSIVKICNENKLDSNITIKTKLSKAENSTLLFNFALRPGKEKAI